MFTMRGTDRTSDGHNLAVGENTFRETISNRGIRRCMRRYNMSGGKLHEALPRADPYTMKLRSVK